LNQARLEFSRSDKKKHLETFTKKIDEINNTKDIDQKQTLTRQLYQDLHRLQNSSSNK
jgi:ABC-type hemin transport system substrate-binding protein